MAKKKTINKTKLIADQAIAPGFSMPLAFAIWDLETPPANLNLKASSADTNLVPVANIVFSGSGSNRTVGITPAPNRG